MTEPEDRSKRSIWWRMYNPEPARYADGRELQWWVILPGAIGMGIAITFARDPSHFIEVVGNLF